MIVIAPNGHFFTHIPQPMQSSSEIAAIFEVGHTSMQSFPILFTGHTRLHSCLHFLGLHLSALTIAIRVFLSAIFSLLFFLVPNW
ncbi:hypothetical protein COEREDRAFT_46771 [Coemansia reversa NRRL 1564]|uniref:Uncharacterized protein n=1 Tax=Coemansia reversa (strain ATCC 12441 / NRRL 1564) TaxID=763665 RepID=A0A2G5B6D5_COERN|nr:hypothetical protein COEREDRAFT_46771 [Coemansia reversa NRRL 1564]|eukprot:PIA14554.1 hypothetical protein COEREDRAFT_46771 [Coemansia reversa NRRL 1564]